VGNPMTVMDTSASFRPPVAPSQGAVGTTFGQRTRTCNFFSGARLVGGTLGLGAAGEELCRVLTAPERDRSRTRGCQ